MPLSFLTVAFRFKQQQIYITFVGRLDNAS